MVLRLKELNEIRYELNHALIYAPDPALLVLDAMEGFLILVYLNLLKDSLIKAIKFWLLKFVMTDKFPPVPLLKEYLKGINDLVKEIHNSGKHNEAEMKEKNASKSVIKCIEEYKLESEYPKDSLVECIEKIDNEKEVKKRSAAAAATKP
ncbi:hypothetical protein LguiB_003161 [Lonicera macranthoides]